MPTQREIAEHLDLTTRRVRDLSNDAGISLTDSLDGIRVAYIRWLRERAAGREAKTGDLDFVAERARLTKEQADKAEIENARLRGRFVDRDEVVAGVERILGALRARLLAMPSKFSALLAGRDAAEIREILDREVRVAMQDMADFEINADGSEVSGTAQKTTAHATAKTDGKRVGRRRAKA